MLLCEVLWRQVVRFVCCNTFYSANTNRKIGDIGSIMLASFRFRQRLFSSMRLLCTQKNNTFMFNCYLIHSCNRFNNQLNCVSLFSRAMMLNDCSGYPRISIHHWGFLHCQTRSGIIRFWNGPMTVGTWCAILHPGIFTMARTSGEWWYTTFPVPVFNH